MNNVKLALLGVPEIEEKLLDQLLLHPSVSAFVSQRAAYHGGHPASFDASEQVLGRADAVLVQALMSGDDAQALISDLKRVFTGAGLRYWLTPVLAEGEF